MTGRAGTWVEVDLSAIRHNVSRFRRHVAPGCRLMAVVKAAAYGHGAVPTARAALQAGADWLGVATLGEGVELREAGIAAPILVLGALFPEEMEDAVRWRLSFTVADDQAVRAAGRAARRVRGVARVHLKVDTGMGRLGQFPPAMVALGERARDEEGVHVEGLFTHLARADEDEAFTGEQVDKLRRVVDDLRRVGVIPEVVHAANSAGTLGATAWHLDMVRVGIALYGLAPSGTGPVPEGLRPALTWKARVSFAKDVPAGTPIGYGSTHVTEARARIVTVPVGYADGYPRLLSNRGQVLIRGHRWPVVGRVCMDQLMVRVPPHVPVAPGEEVVLLGRQGNEVLPAEQLAVWAETINYEIVSRIGSRVPRRYLGEEGMQGGENLSRQGP